MKKCPTCGIVKTREEFYIRKSRKDGLRGQCKSCESIDKKKWREKNRERDRENGKRWYRNNIEKQRDKNKKYREENCDKVAERMKKWILENPEKIKARNDALHAIERGEITKPKVCSKCGNGGLIDGHHEDYSKPLDVVWLCKSCHISLHRGRRAKA